MNDPDINLDIIYKQLRNLPIYECPEFIEFLKNQGGEFHHLLGSQTSLKLNDLLGVKVNSITHAQAERDKKKFCFDNIHLAIRNLCDFVIYQRELLRAGNNNNENIKHKTQKCKIGETKKTLKKAKGTKT